MGKTKAHIGLSPYSNYGKTIRKNAESKFHAPLELDGIRVRGQEEMIDEAET